eukprot:15318218-Alexandrium_andersonii.AAC.1
MMQSSVDENRDDQMGILNAAFELDQIAPHLQCVTLDSGQSSHVQHLARGDQEAAENRMITRL